MMNVSGGKDITSLPKSSSGRFTGGWGVHTSENSGQNSVGVALVMREVEEGLSIKLAPTIQRRFVVQLGTSGALPVSPVPCLSP